MALLGGEASDNRRGQRYREGHGGASSKEDGHRAPVMQARPQSEREKLMGHPGRGASLGQGHGEPQVLCGPRKGQKPRVRSKFTKPLWVETRQRVFRSCKD